MQQIIEASAYCSSRHKPLSFDSRRGLEQKVSCKPHGHNLKNQASSFATVKACYPFTIKGELFSLLCYQPEAFPASLKTLMPVTTNRHQCWPQIWNGQTKAQRHTRFILGRFSHTQSATCRSYRATSDSQAMLLLYRHASFNTASWRTWLKCNGSDQFISRSFIIKQVDLSNKN